MFATLRFRREKKNPHKYAKLFYLFSSINELFTLIFTILCKGNVQKFMHNIFLSIIISFGVWILDGFERELGVEIIGIYFTFIWIMTWIAIIISKYWRDFFTIYSWIFAHNENILIFQKFVFHISICVSRSLLYCICIIPASLQLDYYNATEVFTFNIWLECQMYR